MFIWQIRETTLYQHFTDSCHMITSTSAIVVPTLTSTTVVPVAGYCSCTPCCSGLTNSGEMIQYAHSTDSLNTITYSSATVLRHYQCMTVIYVTRYGSPTPCQSGSNDSWKIISLTDSYSSSVLTQLANDIVY